MSSWNLFFDRLVRSWKFQYRAIRSIADWTIILYLIIPANVFFIMIYRSWWLDTPAWIENIPLFLLFYFFYVFSWNGSIRTFVQEGDKVFLIKKRHSFIGMKNWGYAYSVIFQVLQMAITILIFLPFLRNTYHLDWQQIVTMLIFFISMKPAIMLLKYSLSKIESRVKKIVAGFLIFILIGWSIQFIFFFWGKDGIMIIYAASTFIVAASVILSVRMLKKISGIDHDISMSNEDRMKNINLIFSLSYEIEKPVVTKRTKPLFFRRSKRIFKKRTEVNGFLELFIKIFIRNFSYAGGYLQIISVTTAALVIIPPIWIKALIFVGFLIMLHSWLSIVWDRIASSNPISKKYSDRSFYFTARKIAVSVAFILAILILSIFVACWLLIINLFGIQPGFFRQN